jgi:uncharacterized MAPEG superfamily protein
MTVAFWCVLIVILLPIVCAGIAKFGGGGFEAIPGFAAGVIIAHIAGVAQLVTIDVLAVLFVTTRLLYIIFYLADLAALRSLVWFIGLALVVALFGVSVGTPA